MNRPVREKEMNELDYPLFGGPTFLATDIKERTCQRCGADYVAHGPRLECPDWALTARAVEELKK
jgi:hypothetical protein